MVLTRKTIEGGKHLEIIVLDHIILTSDEMYYSFAEEGDH
jgi:DNA repair protein RadC